ncbi:MAG: hypothetical protein QXY84_04085 [Candidatus Caldarchaeum sp.]
MQDIAFEIIKSTIALFVIVDPVGALPFVASFARGSTDRKERKSSTNPCWLELSCYWFSR